MQEGPRASGRRRVLTGHKEGDHHVSNVGIGKRGPVTVSRAHQGGDHVVVVLRRGRRRRGKQIQSADGQVRNRSNGDSRRLHLPFDP